MATNIGDLLNDVLVIGTNVKAIQQRLKEAETRLIDALALAGTPLLLNGKIVIGDTLITRGALDLYSLTTKQIANVDPSQVVE